MKKHISTILLVLIFLSGFLIVIYPTLCDYLNTRKQKKDIYDYNKKVDELDEEEIEEIFNRAKNYNEELFKAGKSAFYDPEIISGYDEILDITGTGIMGYMTIPKINIELPIYHGTSESVLQVALGHLQGTSLPIGGLSTHSVISGHRGLPTANLFTHIDRLEKNDVFTITILNRVFTYEVDDISIVTPSEVGNLQIEEGRDYCTLLTCTPYGINSHRLLVRGKRVDNISSTGAYIYADAYRIDVKTVAVMMAIPLTIILLIGLFIATNRKKKSSKVIDSGDEYEK